MTKKELLLLSIVILSGLILRVGELNGLVTYDEAYTYVAFASRTWLGALSDYSLPNNHILHTLLIKTSTTFLGNHPWSLRIPTLLAGLGSIFVAYVLGRRIHSPAAGLAAAALLAYLPDFIRYTTDARGYSLVALFTLLGLLAGFSLVEDEKNGRAWLMLSFCSTLGMFTIPTMFLPAMAIYVWLGLDALMKRNWLFLRNGLLSGLLTGLMTFVLYLPVIYYSGWNRLIGNGFVQPDLSQNYYSVLFNIRLWDTWVMWNRGLPLILAVLLVAGFLVALIKSLMKKQISYPLVLIVFLIAYIVFRRPDLYDRFFSFAIPLYVLWAVAGLIEAGERLGGARLKFGKVFAGILLVGLVVFSAWNIPLINQKWHALNNQQVMAEKIAALIKPNDLLVVGYPNDASVWYYLLRLGVAEDVWTKRDDFDNLYVVTARNYDQTPQGLLKKHKVNLSGWDASQAELLKRVGHLELFAVPKGK